MAASRLNDGRPVTRSLRVTPTVIRVLLGAALIVAAALGTTALVASLNPSAPIVIAARDIPVGQTISVTDLALSRGFVESGVRTPFAHVSDVVGMVTTRPVGEGELITNAVIASHRDSRLTSVVIPLAMPVSQSLNPGDTIEVWTTGGISDPLSTTFASSQEPPQSVVLGEYVGPARSDATIISSAEEHAEIMIAQTDAPRLLAALGEKESLVVLPTRVRS